MPKVSVAIPAYNAEKYIALTLESVLGQSFQDFEVVVLNDGSKDSTESIVNSFVARDSRVRVVTQPNGGGISAAQNSAFRNTDPSSKYISFLDSDDTWEPTFIEKLVECLDKHPEYVAAHGSRNVVDSNGNPVPGAYNYERVKVINGVLTELTPDQPTDFAALAMWNLVTTPGQGMMRRDILQRVGPFDEANKSCADWDMWLRTAQLGNIGYVDEPLMNYRNHGGNFSKNYPRMQASRRHMFEKLLGSKDLTSEQRRDIDVGFYFREYSQFADARRALSATLSKGQIRNVIPPLRRTLLHYSRFLVKTFKRPEYRRSFAVK